MKNKHFSPKACNGRVIKPVCFDGPTQMALDEMMLEKCISDQKISMSFRFYTWEGNWLSIGHNQEKLPDKYIELVNKEKISIVRRPSGGNAVLHAGGITYALAWKSPPKKKLESYIKASQWIINGFSKLGVSLLFGKDSSQKNSINCFSSSTHADLIDKDGCKRVGSAQLWRKGSLLQHGEILIAPPKKLWIDVFNANPPSFKPIDISNDSLIELFTKEIINSWPEIQWEVNNLSSIEKETISKKLTSYFS